MTSRSSLQTIKDFDIGVGSFWDGDKDSPEQCVRIPSSFAGQASQSEVKLILWLLLEQEFNPQLRSKSVVDGVGDEECEGFDETDSLNEDVDNSSLNKKAREYATKLLQPAGIELPFERLPRSYKESLFKTFCRSSELLTSDKYTNIAELYEVLRRQSVLHEMYPVEEFVGKGKYSEVNSVICRGDKQLEGQKLALKKVVASWNAMDEIQMIFNECSILKKLSGHARILQYQTSWLALGHSAPTARNPRAREELILYLVTDLCGQSLEQWKMNTAQYALDDDFTLRILYQILDGLDWIHYHKCLHLDLKPGNIFWTSSECTNLKIGDFGLAIEGEIFDDKCGTTPYVAPENCMTAKSDIYSAGMTILEVANHFSTTSELIENAKRISQTGFALEGKLFSILKYMLASSPIERKSANQLKDLIPIAYRS